VTKSENGCGLQQVLPELETSFIGTSTGATGVSRRRALAMLVPSPANGSSGIIERAGVVIASRDGRERALRWAALAI
jgi:hypothetical protein